MSTLAKSPVPVRAAPETGAELARFGRFSADGAEFTITNVATPRPWSNIIANPRFGLAVSHTGSGFTWIDNSQLAVITRWEQDFARDAAGKLLYVRDADSGQVWSVAPAPVFAAYDRYSCTHGLGYTRFETEIHGIRAVWTLFVDAREPIEYWRVEFENLTDRPRRLDVTAFLEWNCGVLPSPRREFHKLFIETALDAATGALLAWNHMWDIPNARWGHWNTSFPYVSAFWCSEAATGLLGDKAAFLGRYGDPRCPAALSAQEWQPRFGRHEDPIAALRTQISLRGGQRRSVGYLLAVGNTREEALGLIRVGCTGRSTGCDGQPSRFQSDAPPLRIGTLAAWDSALSDARAAWQGLLAAERVDTPEPTLNLLVNDWIRYQAIAGRLWGRCGYYQQSGAFGFRDQLQDSQVWLTIEPRRCREQIRLHAAHQFPDGSVYHWWHPLSEQGHITRMTDDLLWLSFVTANYIRESGDLSILADEAPYLDTPGGPAQNGSPRRAYPILDHVLRAFTRVFSRTSARGLPLIGAGDWNDGLSAMGLQERGESVWLAEFLVGLLADWAEIFRRAAAANVAGIAVPAAQLGRLSQEFEERRAQLAATINELAWDGDWYIRGTLDDGSILGSSRNRVGRIFLNAQTWAILNDVAPPDRAARCWAAVREHLVRAPGALLLTPAFDQPDERIGYITRYAPGLRENGGVYTHAATWAIAAAAKMRDAETVERLLTAINPALKDPERYWAEPYVLPGNVDGPESPYYGRAGWTWYTGSAQWLHRIVTHWVLGVRPEWDDLRIDPCLPPAWERAGLTRPWRGATYAINMRRAAGPLRVIVDGQPLPACLVSPPASGQDLHRVEVLIPA